MSPCSVGHGHIPLSQPRCSPKLPEQQSSGTLASRRAHGHPFSGSALSRLPLRLASLDGWVSAGSPVLTGVGGAQTLACGGGGWSCVAPGILCQASGCGISFLVASRALLIMEVEVPRDGGVGPAWLPLSPSPHPGAASRVRTSAWLRCGHAGPGPWVCSLALQDVAA